MEKDFSTQLFLEDLRYQITQNLEINGEYIFKDSVITSQWPITTQAFPHHANFTLKVHSGYALCRKICRPLYKENPSTEGSCIHIKTGALLSFNVISNMKAQPLWNLG